MLSRHATLITSSLPYSYRFSTEVQGPSIGTDWARSISEQLCMHR